MSAGQVILTDDFSALAPRYTGGVSVLASSTVIYLIFKSQTKLRTIYHRIMLGMSSVDILGSLAMGLSTLPMPRGSSEELGFDYDWVGTRLGNIYTCRAQGFFFVLGITAMFTYTCSLCLYYTLAIAFRMKEERITKYWEPFFHGVPLLLGLASSIPPLVTGMINPTGMEAWCTIAGKGIQDFNKLHLAVLIILLSLLSFIFLNFSFIIWRVGKTERALKRAIQEIDHNLRKNDPQHRQLQRVGQLRNNHAQQNAITSMQNTRVVFIQALAYFLSFLITLSMPILRNLPVEKFHNNRIILRIQLILMPLQGLFNALIFIYHKIHNYRRIHPDASRCHVLRLVFFGKADDHVLFSRISMISVNGDNSIDINIHNERNEDDHFHIPINEREEEFASFGEEVFVDEDEDEESRNDLSGFSSLPSIGLSSQIEKEDPNCTHGDLNGANREGRFPPLSLKSADDLSGFSSHLSEARNDNIVTVSVTSPGFNIHRNKRVPADTPTTVPSSGFSP